MMFKNSNKTPELTPAEVHEQLAAGSITLIDVREPNEFAAERIAGALPFPLSAFDPAGLPGGAVRPVVFHCAMGSRSAMAVAKCRAAGMPTAHMQGGIVAWKRAGLPTRMR